MSATKTRKKKKIYLSNGKYMKTETSHSTEKGSKNTEFIVRKNYLM